MCYCWLSGYCVLHQQIIFLSCQGVEFFFLTPEKFANTFLFNQTEDKSAANSAVLGHHFWHWFLGHNF